jgi:hypothetical protein
VDLRNAFSHLAESKTEKIGEEDGATKLFENDIDARMPLILVCNLYHT